MGGAALQYDFTERLDKDDARFRNLRDIRATPRFKLFADKTLGVFTGDVNVATDIANRGQGTLGQANLWATLPFVKHWLFSLGPGVTWADERYMRSFFTITPAQAAVSPLAVYQARAGILDVHLNGVVTYEISSRWSLGASAYAARLRGDAAGSPVTLRRDQTTALAALLLCLYALDFLRHGDSIIGVMIGDGEVWFSGICKGASCAHPPIKITAINP